MIFKKTALISVYDKTGIVEFATALQNKYSYSIVSTGKTAELLLKNGLNVQKVSDVTNFSEILGGRVKTLHPKIFGGILADLTNPEHRRDLKKYSISPISVVVVDLYPFEEEQTIEQIDIGGVSLLRAAAKNFSNVTVVSAISDYKMILEEMKVSGKIPLSMRKRLAAKAFRKTCYYDSLISDYLGNSGDFEDKLLLVFSKSSDLRYGENPHQRGAFYKSEKSDALGISNFQQLQGKELSFNNILDIDAVVNTISFLGKKDPSSVVVKHSNPCGASYGKDIYESFEKAWNGDSLAAFGGIVGVNRGVDEKLATQMISKGFFEVLICPEISKKALELFSQKKNLRILTNLNLYSPSLPKEIDFKHVRGGALIQDFDSLLLSPKNLKTVTKVKPTPKQIKEMLFAWTICRVSKSNTIVLSKNLSLVSSGVGQQDRKRCCELAISKAGERANDSICASDAFFPFPDGPELLIKAGVSAIIQPGGSIKDQETIDLCNKYKVPMVFTGVRCFKH